jgi:hypothetical protein
MDTETKDTEQKPAVEQKSAAQQDQRSGYNPFNPGPDNVTKPVADETQNEDHNARIRELAVELRNASPSGANSISDKILFHLDAIADPKAYNERMAAEKKAADELEAQRAKDRAANKQPVPEKAKA